MYVQKAIKVLHEYIGLFMESKAKILKTFPANTKITNDEENDRRWEGVPGLYLLDKKGKIKLMVSR